MLKCLYHDMVSPASDRACERLATRGARSCAHGRRELGPMPLATAALGREGEPRRKGDPPLLRSQAWARACWYKSRGSVQAKFNVLPVFSCLGPQALLGLHLRLDFILLWAVSYRLGKGWLSVLGKCGQPSPFPVCRPRDSRTAWVRAGIVCAQGSPCWVHSQGA